MNSLLRFPRCLRRTRVAGILAILGTPSLFAGPVLQDLGPYAYGYAINNSGQVAGGISNSLFFDAAFFYSAGGLTNLGAWVGKSSWGYGINNSGQMVGNGNQGAFLYSGGVVTDLGALESAVDINDSGLIAGTSPGNGGKPHAFLYSGGTLTDLDPLSQQRSFAQGLNNLGQVVGLRDSGPETVEAFLYSDGVMNSLGLGANSLASAINDASQITGAAGNVAFLLSPDSEVKLLGTLGGAASIGYGINNLGQVVGLSTMKHGGILHAFLYTDGHLRDLNVLYAHLLRDPGGVGFQVFESAQAISDTGLITGYGEYWDGTQRMRRGFIIDSSQPLPNPVPDAGSTAALFGAAVAAAALLRHRATPEARAS